VIEPPYRSVLNAKIARIGAELYFSPTHSGSLPAVCHLLCLKLLVFSVVSFCFRDVTCSSLCVEQCVLYIILLFDSFRFRGVPVKQCVYHLSPEFVRA